jgi:23S rRNA (cytosine1962-C5)-methyltransferase
MRWCFADSDGIPGLIIDRYLLGSRHGKAQQVLVVQKSTAGAEHLAPNLSELFQELCTDSELLKAGMLPWEQTSIIEKSDLNVRKLEGLELKPAAVVRATADFDASQDSEILVGLNEKPLTLKVNFLLGQKTGFFLDQVWNAEQISQFLAHQIQAQQARGMQNTKIRILDLCCYVGQWGSRLAQTLKELGVPVEIDLVDASEEALLKAKFNCELANSSVVVNTFKKDVLTRWDELPEKSYDIVVCDPPAFVKNVQDLQAGLAAYVKLNTQSLSRVKEGGMLVTASCSGAVRTHDFIDTLSLASQRSKTELQQFFCGGHGPDHTVRPGFPEGQYLKLFAYRVYHRPQE